MSPTCHAGWAFDLANWWGWVGGRPERETLHVLHLDRPCGRECARLLRLVLAARAGGDGQDHRGCEFRASAERAHDAILSPEQRYYGDCWACPSRLVRSSRVATRSCARS